MINQTLAEYAKASQRTWRAPLRGTVEGRTYLLLGLAAEAGEVLDIAAKEIRDGLPAEQVKERMRGELGDALWFVAQLAAEYDLTLEEVAAANIEKLADRDRRGVLKGAGDYR